jgi:hypothetical protein
MSLHQIECFVCHNFIPTLDAYVQVNEFPCSSSYMMSHGIPFSLLL